MGANDLKLLIIDDETNIRNGLSQGLSSLVASISEASDGDEGIDLFRKERHEIVITDMRLPGSINGLDIVRTVRDESPQSQVIVITAYATIETAVEAMRLGAVDFVTKPVDLEIIRHQVKKAVDHLTLIKENQRLKHELSSANRVTDIIGQSTATSHLIKQIHQVANTDATALILGESGTGKELTARAIHQLSERRSEPFVGVNLGALPETLLESELFGHEKGSFTDARRQKIGHFESAGGGTLFLDEITETPSKTQISLLRVLEEREFRRVGGEKVQPFRARVVSATNQDLESLIRDGKFREDLFYRLNVIPIHLPPLRDRKDDIPILVDHFIGHFCEKYHYEKKQISPQAMREIIDRPWPGNIRQLKNMMERLVVTVADMVIRQEDLPAEPVSHREISPTKLSDAVEEAEAQTILKALGHVGYHREKAAKLLEISVRSLHYKMSRYGLH